jgi:hypothetical protein
MDRTTNRKGTGVIELERDSVAHRLFARVKFHIRLIDINMVRNPIVIFDLYRGAQSYPQCIGGKSPAALTDRCHIGRQTGGRHSGQHRHCDERRFHVQFNITRLSDYDGFI